MGLISATQQGAELLQDYGWQSACTPLGAPLGLCIPVDVSRFVEVRHIFFSPIFTSRPSPAELT